MTSRREDELDLTAMSIADMVKNSDNLKAPSNPEWALKEMLRWLQPDQREDVA